MRKLILLIVALLSVMFFVQAVHAEWDYDHSKHQWVWVPDKPCCDSNGSSLSDLSIYQSEKEVRGMNELSDSIRRLSDQIKQQKQEDAYKAYKRKLEKEAGY